MKNKLLIIALLFLVLSDTFENRLFAQLSGDLDTSFNGTGMLIDTVGPMNSEARAVVIQPDGKIIAAGYSGSSMYSVFALSRYLINGAVDTSFGINGEVVVDLFSYDSQIRSLALQPDGKVIVAGFVAWPSSSWYFALARFNPNGTLDSTFGTNGAVTTIVGPEIAVISSIALQTDGKIVAVGHRSTNSSIYNDFVLARYNTNGMLDSTFNNTGLLIFYRAGVNHNSTLASVAIQTDGKIVAAGGADGIAVIRCNTDGTLDSTFNSSGTFYSSADTMYANSLVIQPDGKLLVAGWSWFNYPNYCFVLARLDSSGQLDNTFGVNGITLTDFGNGNDYANAIALQQDGKIVAAGSSDTDPDLGYTDFDFAIACYNSNGTLDLNFSSDGKLTTKFTWVWVDIASAIAIQPDGKIIAAGTANGLTFALSRYHFLLSTGIVDLSVDTNSLIVYPNPTSNQITIEGFVMNSEIKILDITGKIIYSQKLSNTQKIEVNTSDFAEGVYLVKIQTENFIETQKVIISK
ncbi:MAG: T9SS type A sorting domain-containing protein [Bacteroidetes bacterium]|nr:T9SS type A sorting domain-containing protein [Bacteroidota bacterium]